MSAKWGAPQVCVKKFAQKGGINLVEIIERKENFLYIDGNNFAREIINRCPFQSSNLVANTKWLTFVPSIIDSYLDAEIKEIIKYISDLRKQQRDEDAIDLSDAFFQSFTPLMNIFAEQKNFYQISQMWIWLISKVKKIEEENSIEFGEGVHKGTAFYFLGFSQLMMRDIDGAYLSFAEAAKEDEILPKSVLNRHQKGLPPVVKILLLDLSEDNFAYNLVKQIRKTISEWEQQHPQICRDTSIFTSMQNAIDKNKMPRESAIHLCYAFIKAFILNLWRQSFVRPTFLTITQMGESILRFARTLEDFIRFSKNLNRNIKIFNYCHDTWFPSENWNVPSYENDIESLINDFINDKWNFSKDGKNMLFTLKIRNLLAHRIPDNPVLFERYIEIILVISSSFGFVCDEISR